MRFSTHNLREEIKKLKNPRNLTTNKKETKHKTLMLILRIRERRSFTAWFMEMTILLKSVLVERKLVNFRKTHPTQQFLKTISPPNNNLLIINPCMGLLHISLMKLKMMSSETIHLNIGSQSYEPPTERKNDDVPSKKPSVSTPPPSNGL